MSPLFNTEKKIQPPILPTNLHFDPDLIPNSKERLRKEAYSLLRHACSINEAAISLGNHYTVALQVDRSKIPARIQAGKIFSAQLEEQADRILNDAIVRYTQYLREPADATQG